MWNVFKIQSTASNPYSGLTRRLWPDCSSWSGVRPETKAITLVSPLVSPGSPPSLSQGRLRALKAPILTSLPDLAITKTWQIRLHVPSKVHACTPPKGYTWYLVSIYICKWVLESPIHCIFMYLHNCLFCVASTQNLTMASLSLNSNQRYRTSIQW